MKRSRKKIRPRLGWFTFADDSELPWKGWLPKHLRGKGVNRFRKRNRRYLAKRSGMTAIDWVLRDVFRINGRPPSLDGVFKW